jgi:glutamate dehydrogenase (NAD(P)+)
MLVDNKEFYKELMVLNQRFNATSPVFELTLRDNLLGVEGYVVLWNTEIAESGPLGAIAKGGTRITPSLSLEEVRMLARTMDLKNAAADLPLGGAKSGLRADPDSKNFETKYRRMVSLCSSFLAENGGPFGGFGFDIGARPEQARWCCDELGSTKSFTGKPLDLGGTDYDKEGIAGIGIAQAAKTLLEENGDDIQGSRCAIQGMGNVGAAVLKDLLLMGADIACVSDPRIGGTFLFKKLPSTELLAALGSQQFEISRELLLAEAHTQLPLDEVLFQDVKILFPCAIQDVLRADNASAVQASYVIEGANGPCTSDARANFYDRQISLLPDFIANPGGVIAAYVELLHANGIKFEHEQGNPVETAKYFTRLKISDNIKQLMGIVRKLEVEPAHAGRYLALKKYYREEITN